MLLARRNSRYMHLSIDDVVWVLENIVHFNYSSIFEQPLLSYLKKQHEEFGIVVSLYCFYKFQGFSLPQMSSTYKQEFTENSSWLKFAFHSYDDSRDYFFCQPHTIVADYCATTDELLRITGSAKCIDYVPRLHRYRVSPACLFAMRTVPNGIRGVLTNEDQRPEINYGLCRKENELLDRKGYYFDRNNEIAYYKTTLRIESYKDSNSLFENLKPAGKKPIVIFTHEWALDEVNLKKLSDIIGWAANNGFRFDYPENNVRGTCFG